MSNTLLVVLALAALLVGPMLALVWSRGRAWRAVIDGLSLSLVGGICLLVVFPHAIDVAGPIGFAAIIPGMVVPGWAHRLGEYWQRRFVYAGMVLLAVHAAVDGAALTLPSTSMGVAVIAHRLPMGLAVYSAASRSAAGQQAGFAAVAILIVSTLVGVAIGEPMSGLGGPIGHGAFEGFVGGLLLHIVFEHAPVFPAPEHPDLLGRGLHPDRAFHGHQHSSARQVARGGGNRWSAVGALLGLVIVGGLVASQGDDPHAHHADVSFLQALWELTLNTAPWLVGAYLVATLWHRIAPEADSRRKTGTPVLQGLHGVVLGARQPLCASGVIPMTEHHLARKGSPPAWVAFLVATPTLGLPALSVSAGLFGTNLTLIRFGMILGIAVLAGVLVRRARRVSAHQDAAAPIPSTWTRSARFGLGTLIDHTLPWVVLGILMGGLAAVALPDLRVAAWPAAVQIPLCTILSVPLFVSATGAAPTAIALMDHGLSTGAAVAMLLAGPALNPSALALLRRHLGTNATWTVAIVVLGGAMVAGGAVEALGWTPQPLVESTTASALHLASVGVLVVLAARSTFRQGARGVLAQIIQPIEDWNPPSDDIVGDARAHDSETGGQHNHR